MALRIPLKAFFFLVGFCIVSGLVAVILLLTLSQRESYATAIRQKIDLSQSKANLTILEPLLRREIALEHLAKKMLAAPSTYIANGHTLAKDIPDFFTDAQLFATDPQMIKIFQLCETNIPRNLSAGDDGNHIIAAMLFPSTAATYAGGILMNYSIDAFIWGTFYPPAYPYTTKWIQANVMETQYGLSLDVKKDPSFSTFQMPSKRHWTPTVFDDFISVKLVFDFSYAIPLEIDPITRNVKSGLYLSINLLDLTEKVLDARASTATTGLLVDHWTNAYIASTDPTFIGFDVENEKLYTMDSLPHTVLRNLYEVTSENCPPEDCNYTLFDHGEDLFSSISIKTETIHFIMCQSTPRSFFFGDWDDKIIIGTVIGALVAFFVLLACLFLWFLIWKNITTLTEAMQLASKMRNTEARELSSSAPSFLTEISIIQIAFEAMNDKLLVARPFMPQALLLLDDDDFDQNGGGHDDEENEMVAMGMGGLRNRRRQNGRGGGGGGENFYHDEANSYSYSDDDDEDEDFYGDEGDFDEGDLCSSSGPNEQQQPSRRFLLSGGDNASSSPSACTPQQGALHYHHHNHHTSTAAAAAAGGTAVGGPTVLVIGGRMNTDNSTETSGKAGDEVSNDVIVFGGGLISPAEAELVAFPGGMIEVGGGAGGTGARRKNKLTATTLAAAASSSGGPKKDSGSINNNNAYTSTSVSHASAAVNLMIGAGPSSALLSSALLANKNVAVMSINIRNFHELAKKNTAEATIRLHALLAAIVEKRVNDEKGVVDAFHGDRFTITFNVARTAARPAQRAALAALAICDELESNGNVLSHRHPFSMGISCGKALVGNLGTATIKKLCTIGAVFPEAVALERVSRWVGTPVIVSERVRNELEHCVHCFLIGAVKMKPTVANQQQQHPLSIPSSAAAAATSNMTAVSGNNNTTVSTSHPHPHPGSPSAKPITMPRMMQNVAHQQQPAARPAAPTTAFGGVGRRRAQSVMGRPQGLRLPTIMLNTGGAAPASATAASGGGVTSTTAVHPSAKISEVFAAMTKIDVHHHGNGASDGGPTAIGIGGGGGGDDEWLYIIDKMKDTNVFRRLEEEVRGVMVKGGGRVSNVFVGAAAVATAAATPSNTLAAPASSRHHHNTSTVPAAATQVVSVPPAAGGGADAFSSPAPVAAIVRVESAVSLSQQKQQQQQFERVDSRVDLRINCSGEGREEGGGGPPTIGHHNNNPTTMPMIVASAADSLFDHSGTFSNSGGIVGMMMGGGGGGAFANRTRSSSVNLLSTTHNNFQQNQNHHLPLLLGKMSSAAATSCACGGTNTTAAAMVHRVPSMADSSSRSSSSSAATSVRGRGARVTTTMTTAVPNCAAIGAAKQQQQQLAAMVRSPMEEEFAHHHLHLHKNNPQQQQQQASAPLGDAFAVADALLSHHCPYSVANEEEEYGGGGGGDSVNNNNGNSVAQIGGGGGAMAMTTRQRGSGCGLQDDQHNTTITPTPPTSFKLPLGSSDPNPNNGTTSTAAPIMIPMHSPRGGGGIRIVSVTSPVTTPLLQQNNNNANATTTFISNDSFGGIPQQQQQQQQQNNNSHHFSFILASSASVFPEYDPTTTTSADINATTTINAVAVTAAQPPPLPTKPRTIEWAARRRDDIVRIGAVPLYDLSR